MAPKPAGTVATNTARASSSVVVGVTRRRVASSILLPITPTAGDEMHAGAPSSVCDDSSFLSLSLYLYLYLSLSVVETGKARKRRTRAVSRRQDATCTKGDEVESTRPSRAVISSI